MTPWLAAIALSIASAAGYAGAAVAQHRLAVQSAVPSGPLGYLGSIRWWRTAALNAVGAGLHVLALRYGSLIVVQPFGALTLVFALPLGALLTGHRVTGRQVTGREWCGALTILIGLAGLALVSDQHVRPSALGTPTIVVLVVLTVGVIGVLALATGTSPRTTALCRAAASGLASAVASVLTQTALLRLAGPVAGIVPVTVLMVATTGVLAVCGLLLAQLAYATGLGSTLAVLTIANPVTTTAIGLVLFDPPSGPGGAGILLTALAVVVASCGVVLVTTCGTRGASWHHRPPQRRAARSPRAVGAHRVSGKWPRGSDGGVS